VSCDPDRDAMAITAILIGRVIFSYFGEELNEQKHDILNNFCLLLEHFDFRGKTFVTYFINISFNFFLIFSALYNKANFDFLCRQSK
jgi:hypothetical protein